MLLNTEQKVRATLAPLTAGGNAAPVENVRWEADEGPLAVEVSDNPLVCDFRALPLADENPVTMQVRCLFDADLGAGVREMVAIGEITVVPAEAVIASIAFGTPEPQVTAAPEPAPAPEPPAEPTPST